MVVVMKESNRNEVVVLEGKQSKCGGGIQLHYSRLVSLQITCLET